MPNLNDPFKGNEKEGAACNAVLFNLLDPISLTLPDDHNGPAECTSNVAGGCIELLVIDA